MEKSGGLPGSSVVKDLPANAGDTGSIPVWEDLACLGATGLTTTQLSSLCSRAGSLNYRSPLLPGARAPP